MPTDPLQAASKAIETIAPQAYSDLVSDTFKEASGIGVDLVKTLRLIFFPLQFTAAMQDRLARRIKQSIAQVPEGRRIVPVSSIAHEVAERMRFQDDGSVLAEMYINLLARAMDRDRVGEAHPAFIQLIGQLAPDEVLLLAQLAELDFRLYTRPLEKGMHVHSPEERKAAFEAFTSAETDPLELAHRSIRPEDLGQTHLVYTYIEHLVSLGLVRYSNNHYPDTNRRNRPIDFWCIQLSQFGALFHKACVDGAQSAAA
ncbi:Abi-alpha family protein [Achromobacter xylosoxidans]|uniref:Abi-alpha family protein n=1 Tax=Alcaligenes xylosoxydans xylosoxydans TaxID=85698 RepID=UPI0012A9476D|nr:Abi-alpha family protein [Achromobacter xylosoxidans]WNO49129.1 hypothetical protein [Achromobacter phage CF418P1]CUR74783.1 hypothetical protein BN2905_36570 [Achromobacter xylosoxidans]